MKARMLRWYDALLAAIVSMLGFSACGLDDDSIGTDGDKTIILMYGAPSVTYRVSGTVSAGLAEPTTPLPGIRVRAEFFGPEGQTLDALADTLTDASGRFALDVIFERSEPVRLIFDDVDGPENGGEFVSDTLDLRPYVEEKAAEGAFDDLSQGPVPMDIDVKLNPI